MSKLIGFFAAFCVATVITQVIMAGYFVSRGAASGDTLTKIIALLNGIDISGNQLRQALRDNDDREQPDFEEILEARKLDNYDMDLRLRSQQDFRDELTAMLEELKDQRQKFDDRRVEFLDKLDEIENGALDAGLRDVQRMLQAIDPVQSKQLLVRMYDDERIDDVVTIIQEMPIDRAKDIVAEFTSQDEQDKLAEILRRIGDGKPATSLIDETRQDL